MTKTEQKQFSVKEFSLIERVYWLFLNLLFITLTNENILLSFVIMILSLFVTVIILSSLNTLSKFSKSLSILLSPLSYCNTNLSPINKYLLLVTELIKNHQQK